MICRFQELINQYKQVVLNEQKCLKDQILIRYNFCNKSFNSNISEMYSNNNQIKKVQIPNNQNQHFQPHQIPHYIQPQQYTQIKAPSTVQFQTTKAKVTYWRQDQILSNIDNLDSINQKLLKIADSIAKTSFMDHQKPVPTIIVQLQNDLRTILTELIANVKEFFIDIDSKLKTVVESININRGNSNQFIHPKRTVSSNNFNQTGNHKINNNSNQSSQNSVKTNPNQNSEQEYGYRDTMKSDNVKYAILSSKVEALQVNLKRTQNNQEKLMQVISALMEKYKISEQPTIIRQDPALSNHFSNRQKFGVVNSAGNTNNTKKQYSIHEKLYSIPQGHQNYSHGNPHLNIHPYQESQVTETVMPKSYIAEQQEQEEPEQFIRKIYAKNQVPQECLSPNRLLNPLNKKSLKSTSTIQMQKNSIRQEDKSHRLTFMMNNLRQ